MLLICFTNEKPISSALSEMLDPFTVLFYFRPRQLLVLRKLCQRQRGAGSPWDPGGEGQRYIWIPAEPICPWFSCRKGVQLSLAVPLVGRTADVPGGFFKVIKG